MRRARVGARHGADGSLGGMDFATIMALEPHGPDTYVGIGPSYPWGGLYGGQIVAQGLRAAALTVGPEFRVHSLHAYFIRLGDASQPIRFEVDRVRNGRTFCTRHITVRQAVGAILDMTVSFQVDEVAPEVQIAQLDDVRRPDDMGAQECWSPLFERKMVVHRREPGRSAGWFKMTEPVGDDGLAHAAALAYLSDDLPTDAVVTLHPDCPPAGSEDYPFWNASLDHAIWFHRPMRADEWHLHDFVCRGLMSSRGLAIGNIFALDGTHVATVAQEVLLRPSR